MVRLYLNGELVKTHAFQARGRKTDWADLPAERAAFYMRTPVWCGLRQCSSARPLTPLSASCWR